MAVSPQDPAFAQAQMELAQHQAMHTIVANMPRAAQPFSEALLNLISPSRKEPDTRMLKGLGAAAERANRYARVWRGGGQATHNYFKEILDGRFESGAEGVDERTPTQLRKAQALAKAGPLDVGTNVNFSQITGGQSVGYVSLDTQLARGTIRPDSFALYQALPKSQAFQVVDFWAYSDDTGNNLPGTNFTGFGNVSSGSLTTTAGAYALDNITLKLAANGRAITTALAAQNSFVDIAAQENANAALGVLSDFDWGCFWGDSTLYPNQPNGIYKTLQLNTSGNIVNFQNYLSDTSYAGLTNDQLLFNLIYDQTAQITKWGNFGHITHAFMDQNTIASLQSLTTTLLNNIVNVNSFGIKTSEERNLRGVTINGDLDGMLTRFGQIHFPVDILLNSRDVPAQARNNATTTFSTSTGPTPPAGVTASVTGITSSQTSYWTSGYTASSGQYVYAVASTNAAIVESTLTYSAVVSGVSASPSASATSGAYNVAITPPAAGDATVFRVYRSGLGYTLTTGQLPGSFRYIGSIAASGASVVNFVDTNSHIPGSSSIFLLDMDENDKALDFRFLLPLTKIELFAQNLYMPWAVAMIGSPRLRVSKFHSVISNYVPDNAAWSSLQPNLAGTI